MSTHPTREPTTNKRDNFTTFQLGESKSFLRYCRGMDKGLLRGTEMSEAIFSLKRSPHAGLKTWKSHHRRAGKATVGSLTDRTNSFLKWLLIVFITLGRSVVDLVSFRNFLGPMSLHPSSSIHMKVLYKITTIMYWQVDMLLYCYYNLKGWWYIFLWSILSSKTGFSIPLVDVIPQKSRWKQNLDYLSILYPHRLYHASFTCGFNYSWNFLFSTEHLFLEVALALLHAKNKHSNNAAQAERNWNWCCLPQLPFHSISHCVVKAISPEYQPALLISIFLPRKMNALLPFQAFLIWLPWHPTWPFYFQMGSLFIVRVFGFLFQLVYLACSTSLAILQCSLYTRESRKKLVKYHFLLIQFLPIIQMQHSLHYFHFHCVNFSRIQ